MSTITTPAPTRHFDRLRRAGHSVRNVFSEMVAARELALGRARR